VQTAVLYEVKKLLCLRVCERKEAGNWRALCAECVCDRERESTVVGRDGSTDSVNGKTAGVEGRVIFLTVCLHPVHKFCFSQ
jgi:hypothetical protein